MEAGAAGGQEPRTAPGVTPGMIRLDLQVELRYDVGDPGADFLFNVHVAQTPNQRLLGESLSLSQRLDSRMHTDTATGNRYLQLRADPGPLTLAYQANVVLRHQRTDPSVLEEVPVHRLPGEALHYLYPSRYCQSDRLLNLANHEFGGLVQGYARIEAIRSWVQQEVTYTVNSSDSTTSALDTLIERVGICRDFAHLMIALCRAINVPARFVTGTDFGANRALSPPDFHAYVEVYLGDGWYIFDPSGTGIPMGFVRIGTGRDAADVAFASIFGPVTWQAPTILASVVEDPQQGFVRPTHTTDALSTDRGA
jgi:transglutaminase-like putative cysteine protease